MLRFDFDIFSMAPISTGAPVPISDARRVPDRSIPHLDRYGRRRRCGDLWTTMPWVNRPATRLVVPA